MTIRITGVRAIISSIRKSKKRTRKRLAAGLFEGGKVLKQNALRKTPEEHGNLKESLYLVGTFEKEKAGNFNDLSDNLPQLTRDHAQHILEAETLASRKNLRVVLGYSAFYSIFVHEDLSKSHPTGEAKFLERARNENKSAIKQAILKRGSRQ